MRIADRVDKVRWRVDMMPALSCPPSHSLKQHSSVDGSRREGEAEDIPSEGKYVITSFSRGKRYLSLQSDGPSPSAGGW